MTEYLDAWPETEVTPKDFQSQKPWNIMKLQMHVPESTEEHSGIPELTNKN